MKLLLGSLLLGGVCWLGAAIDFPTMMNFDNQKVSGKWYPLANIVIEKQYPEYTLKAAPKGSLMYSFKYSENNKCKMKKFRFAQNGVPGKFKTTSPAAFQVLDTDYDSYIITYIVRGMDSFLTLASREQTMTPTLEAKFKEFATSVQVTGDVVAVSQTESC